MAQLVEHYTGGQRVDNLRLTVGGVLEQSTLSAAYNLFNPGRQEIVPTQLKNC